MSHSKFTDHQMERCIGRWEEGRDSIDNIFVDRKET